jgi:hypothetical protein
MAYTREPGRAMPDIMIRCPALGTTVSTGLSTEAIIFASLPANLAVPLQCPACGRVHKWNRGDAWVSGQSPKRTRQHPENSN